MLAYRAYLNIPTHIADTITCWLDAHRLIHDRRRYQRAASCTTQTLLVLRWLIDATPLHRLAYESNISQATAYRYLHEALEVIASYAPDLEQVLANLQSNNELIACLDGTLIHTDAVATRKPTTSGNVGWF